MTGINKKNVGKSFLRVIEGCISIIEQTNAIPYVRVLRLGNESQSE